MELCSSATLSYNKVNMEFFPQYMKLLTMEKSKSLTLSKN